MPDEACAGRTACLIRVAPGNTAVASCGKGFTGAPVRTGRMPLGNGLFIGAGCAAICDSTA